MNYNKRSKVVKTEADEDKLSSNALLARQNSNTLLKNSLLAAGLKKSGASRRGRGGQRNELPSSQLAVSMSIQNNTNDVKITNNSFEGIRASQNMSQRSDGDSLPSIEPVRIKNKIYHMVQKYPGKPLFKTNQLLKPDEIFIGGVEEDR